MKMTLLTRATAFIWIFTLIPVKTLGQTGSSSSDSKVRTAQTQLTPDNPPPGNPDQIMNALKKEAKDCPLITADELNNAMGKVALIVKNNKNNESKLSPQCAKNSSELTGQIYGYYEEMKSEKTYDYDVSVKASVGSFVLSDRTHDEKIAAQLSTISTSLDTLLTNCNTDITGDLVAVSALVSSINPTAGYVVGPITLAALSILKTIKKITDKRGPTSILSKSNLCSANKLMQKSRSSNCEAMAFNRGTKQGQSSQQVYTELVEKKSERLDKNKTYKILQSLSQLQSTLVDFTKIKDDTTDYKNPSKIKTLITDLQTTWSSMNCVDLENLDKTDVYKKEECHQLHQTIRTLSDEEGIFGMLGNINHDSTKFGERKIARETFLLNMLSEVQNGIFNNIRSTIKNELDSKVDPSTITGESCDDVNYGVRMVNGSKTFTTSDSVYRSGLVADAGSTAEEAFLLIPGNFISENKNKSDPKMPDFCTQLTCLWANAEDADFIKDLSNPSDLLKSKLSKESPYSPFDVQSMNNLKNLVPSYTKVSNAGYDKFVTYCQNKFPEETCKISCENPKVCEERGGTHCKNSDQKSDSPPQRDGIANSSK